jgi:hypothetical protein
MTNPADAAWPMAIRAALLAGEDDCLFGRSTPDALPGPLAALLALPEHDRGLGAAAKAVLHDPALGGPEVQAPAAILVLLRCGFAGVEAPGWVSAGTRALAHATDPETKGLLMLAIALHERERMTCAEYADLVVGAIAILPEHAAIRAVHLHQAAMFLALRGMLRLLDGHLALPLPGDAEPSVPVGLVAECFYDAVVNGRIAQARHLLAAIRDAGPSLAWQQGLIDAHAGYLEIFAAIQEDRPLPPPRIVPSGPILHALVARDVDFLAAYTPAPGGAALPIIAYDDLRGALAMRDGAAARRIIDDRATRASRHPLDDVFLARLLLIEDLPREAMEAVERVSAHADRFDAWGRLEIELRLANELNRSDLPASACAGSWQRPWSWIPACASSTGPVSPPRGSGSGSPGLRCRRGRGSCWPDRRMGRGLPSRRRSMPGTAGVPSPA